MRDIVTKATSSALVKIVQDGSEQLIPSDRVLGDLRMINGTQTILDFAHDREIFITTPGSTLTFTLRSPVNLNSNGSGIVLRINRPTSVTFPANFEASASSDALDATKLNMYTLVYFSNWDGLGTPRVVYTNKVFTQTS